MRKTIYFIFNILLFTGCKKELSPQESTIDFTKVTNTNQTSNNQQVAPNTLTNNTSSTVVTKPNPPHGQPGHVCGTQTQQPNTKNQAQNVPNQQFTVSQPITATNKQIITKVAKGMNPPHGQSGHRCDISVGAPLNSKPKTTTTSTNNTPALVSSSNAAPIAQVAPGMNPPHGQPGHVCGTPVGSPLNKENKTEENKPVETTKPLEIKNDN